jgi:ankyrin repeat protein
MVEQGSDLSVTNHVSRFKLISAATAHLVQAGLTPLEMLPSDYFLPSAVSTVQSLVVSSSKHSLKAFKLLQMTLATEALDAVRYLVYSRGLALNSKNENVTLSSLSSSANSLTSQGETVLDWAIKEKRVSVVSLIRGLGGDVNARNNVEP